MYKDFIRNRINMIRNANKLSARGLSLDLGYATEYINQIERGRSNPSVEFLLVFCEHFKMTIGEFFDESVKYPMHLKSIVENLKKLNADELASVSDIVKRLAYKKG